MTRKLLSAQREQILQPVARARGAHMAVLVGPETGDVRFVTRRFRLDPGGRIPRHRHPDIEHEQVMLSGEMTLGLDDESHVVRPGDAVLIPAGTAHWYENRGEKPAEFICVVPVTPRYDTEWLEDAPAGAYMPPQDP
jgi:quercetin dioxygenase-like cupin family protein